MQKRAAATLPEDTECAELDEDVSSGKRLYVSDEDDELSKSLEVLVAPPPVKTAKKARVGVAPRVMTVKIHPLPAWAPMQMKVDIINTNTGVNTAAKQGELLSCIRFYTRYCFLQKRVYVLSDCKEFALAFGITDAQAGTVGTNLEHMGDQPFGVLVAERFRQVKDVVLYKIRENFDSLFRMCWESDGMQGFISGQMLILEAYKKAAEMREAAGIQSNVQRREPEVVIIDDGVMNERFLKNNMKLITDVWNPILDGVEDGFLLRDNEWGKRFLKSTSIILSWYLTYHFQLDDPKGAMQAEGKGGIDASKKTMAIAKGDLPLVEFPQMKKPLKWGNRRQVPWYGELPGGKGLLESVKEEIEYQMIEDLVKKNEGSGEPMMQKVCLGVVEHGVVNEFERLQELVKQRADLLEQYSKEYLADANESREKISRMGKWMVDGKANAELIGKQRVANHAVNQFVEDARLAYENAVKEELRYRVEGGQQPETSSLDVLGTYHVWQSELKKRGVFKDAVARYESSFTELMPAPKLNFAEGAALKASLPGMPSTMGGEFDGNAAQLQFEQFMLWMNMREQGKCGGENISGSGVGSVLSEAEDMGLGGSSADFDVMQARAKAGIDPSVVGALSSSTNATGSPSRVCALEEEEGMDIIYKSFEE